jgi:UTP--glucose-1-phosphate uridylyltransferase
MPVSIPVAVIPVAGFGTRSLPFTKEIPKELLPALDVPAIQLIVEEAASAGVETVVLVTGRGKHAIEDHFSPRPELEQFLRARGKEALLDRIATLPKRCEVIAVRQPAPLGLGHAVECARPVVGQRRFAVLLGDEIFLRRRPEEPTGLGTLAAAAVPEGHSTVGILDVPASETKNYGIVDLGGVAPDRGPVPVKGSVEKPEPGKAPSRYAIIGRYVFSPDIFDALADVPFGKGGEKQLTDAMDRLCRQGRLHAVKMPSNRYDMGSALGFLKAQVDTALARPELAPAVVAYLRERVALLEKEPRP